MENYFNYFTEIEECFRRCRGTPTLLSTLDWALIESWKEAGVPLQAVLIGVERAFQKFTKRPRRFQKVNGLGYCSPTVLQAAEELKATQVEGGAKPRPEVATAAPFTDEEIFGYITRNAEAVERAARQAQENRESVLAEDLAGAGLALRELTAQGSKNAGAHFEEIERRLSALEEKINASFTRAASVELLSECQREVERGLSSYRRKMTAAQIDSLERQFLKKRLFEHYRVPRLSLFHL